MLATITIIAILFLIIFLFLKQPKFGKLPTGKRLERIKQSPNYRDGSFQNVSITPSLTEGTSYWKLLKQFFFDKKERSKPIDKIPSIKTDLLNLDKDKNSLIWFGHSSYFMQIDGKTMLVDPVLSGSASPIPSGIKAFSGSDIYTTDDFPEIDFLFISHDHWDHLDYKTIIKLKPKINKIICGLGVAAHFEHWGFDENKIIEKDWNETIHLDDNFTVYTQTARHFSGRGLMRNKALWMSYVLQTPTMRLFIGGDSGYDSHFAEIGTKFGPFDLAILENGQYDNKWRYIHTLPNEFLKVAKELNAKRILPVHSSKFVLGNHAWDEPLEVLSKNNETENLTIITPIIGEEVSLNDTNQSFTKWWKTIK